jgi:hypothetical protein
MNTTTGSTFVVVVAGGSGAGYTPTDNKGNTWPASAAVNFDSAGARLAIWVLENGTGGAGHTVTVTSAGGDSVFSFHEVTGVLAASLDSAATASGSGAEPFTLNAAATLAQANNTVISAMLPYMSGDPVTYACTTGYTLHTQENNNNSFYGQGVASKSVTSTTAPSAQWDTTGATGDVFAGIIVLKESAGTSYDLTVDPASYALTATAETVTATRALTISPASYTLTAAAETLTATRALSIDPASYSLTNSAVTLTVARALSIDPAAYALTAADVELEYASSAKELIVDPASYVFSLADVALEYVSVSREQLSYSAPAKKRKYNYDYSSPKVAEAVEPAKAPVKAVTQKAKKSISPDMVEMLGLIEASQSVTAEVLSEQMAMRAAEQRQFEEEQEMMAVIACCL